MAVKHIPDGFRTLTPYVMVQGAASMVEFVKRTFDSEILNVVKAPDGTVHHAEMRIGDSMLMASEASPDWPAMPASLYVYVRDIDATYQRALEAGGTSIHPPKDQYYGDRSAGVKDPAGNAWWIATHIEDVSPEELERRTKAYASERG